MEARLGAPDAAWEPYGAGGARGNSAVGRPDAQAKDLIGERWTADSGTSRNDLQSADALANNSDLVVSTGGTGGLADLTGGSGGDGVATGGTGGVAVSTSETAGAPTGGMGGVAVSTSAAAVVPTGGMGGITVSTGTTGGSPTGGSSGNPASTGRMGGAFWPIGGATFQTGGSKGSSGAISSSSPLRSCGGVVEASDTSICWYLGDTGASCVQTCAPHGGVSPNAAKQIGTAAQGGSASKCEKLFELLGSKVSVFTVQIAAGLGCHIKAGMQFPNAWASSPDYNASASESDVRIVCGCML